MSFIENVMWYGSQVRYGSIPLLTNKNQNLKWQYHTGKFSMAFHKTFLIISILFFEK